jgi:hypothetical protein
MARIGGEGDGDRAGGGLAAPFGAEVVLDVARPALDIGGDDLDGALALELPDDLLVRRDRVQDVRRPRCAIPITAGDCRRRARLRRLAASGSGRRP